jgi:hypothetical protein
VQQFRVADDVDEQNMRDLQPEIPVRLPTHHPSRVREFPKTRTTLQFSTEIVREQEKRETLLAPIQHMNYTKEDKVCFTKRCQPVGANYRRNK